MHPSQRQQPQGLLGKAGPALTPGSRGSSATLSPSFLPWGSGVRMELRLPGANHEVASVRMNADH